MFDTIKYTVDSDNLVANIRLDRPDNLNSINNVMIEELCGAISKSEENDDVRVILISGVGEHFSAGYDIAEGIEGTLPPTVDSQLDRYENSTNHIQSIWHCNKPVIAKVSGYCLAGGNDLAIACDLVVASEDATFGYPGIRMGGVPPTLMYPFIMNLHETKEILLSGKQISSERANELGMINKVVPKADLDNIVMDEVDEILKVPGNNVRIMKHILNGIAEDQGLQPMMKYSELFDALAHHTEYGYEYYKVAESSSFEEILIYLNNTDKKMTPDPNKDS